MKMDLDIRPLSHIHLQEEKQPPGKTAEAFCQLLVNFPKLTKRDIFEKKQIILFFGFQ